MSTACACRQDLDEMKAQLDAARADAARLARVLSRARNCGIDPMTAIAIDEVLAVHAIQPLPDSGVPVAKLQHVIAVIRDEGHVLAKHAADEDDTNAAIKMIEFADMLSDLVNNRPTPERS